MRVFIILSLLFISGLGLAQEAGTIAGKLVDKENNNEPLPFANVIIKDTNKGTTSDFDGNFEITNVPVGSYTIEVSFVGYETVDIPNVIVEANKTTTINTGLGASAAALEEVLIKVETSRERESALLLDQKKAVIVKESIGAEQLTRLGVSDASAATTKISGVSKSDGTGQIYVRGLGDRYLTTTLNGLPVPSDNIDKKNIDLALFPTRFVQNVSISKTFSPNNSADQASGNVNIDSKEATKANDYGATMSTGVNSNVGDSDVFNNFKVTANNEDINFGIYSRAYTANNLGNALLGQSWETQQIGTPLNYAVAFNAGGKIGENKKLGGYFSGGQSVDHEYREGIFRQFDQGNLRDIVPDNDNVRWLREVNTVGMFTSQYKINESNRLNFNSFIINKVFEETYEAGRKGTTVRFEELDNAEQGFQFVRDQNIKNTFLTITQLGGVHDLSENNTLNWSAGYNYVAANEPNRIRNELNILNDDPNTPENEQGEIQLAFVGGTQQRKSVQQITDEEFAANIKDQLVLKRDENEDEIYTLSFGGDYRNKQRGFRSQFFGIFEAADRGTVNPPSIDNISEIFIEENFINGSLGFNTVDPDFYEADLTSYAGFVDFIGLFDKFTVEAGLRYQQDEIDVLFDVGNYINPVTFQARFGRSLQNYERLYPSFNVKYDLNDKSALRLAGSLSQTLPEFKEIAPFEYVSPEGLIEAGNPNIQASRNLNVDLKYELFPSSNELISATAFYKRIEDPINKTLRLGGDGAVFSYFNTGEEARVLGVELEGRVYIVAKRDSLPNVKLSGNVSYLDHVQDLKEERNGDGMLTRTFQYDGNEQIGLEGASDWITNLALTYNSGTRNPYEITLASNYASDRIYAIGAPRNQSNSETFFNGEIVEKGVVRLDFIMNKEINKHWNIGLSAINLLNPTIERYQINRSPSTGIRSTDTVLTYTTGINTSLSINYTF